MKSLFFLSLVSVTLIGNSAPTTPINAYTEIYNQEEPLLMLYYSPSCPFSIKVLNYLKAINKTVPMKNIYASPEIKEELKNQGGKLQIPCLMIDGEPLYDSDQIIQWLAANKDLY